MTADNSTKSPVGYFFGSGEDDTTYQETIARNMFNQNYESAAKVLNINVDHPYIFSRSYNQKESLSQGGLTIHESFMDFVIRTALYHRHVDSSFLNTKKNLVAKVLEGMRDHFFDDQDVLNEKVITKIDKYCLSAVDNSGSKSIDKCKEFKDQVSSEYFRFKRMRSGVGSILLSENERLKNIQSAINDYSTFIETVGKLITPIADVTSGDGVTGSTNNNELGLDSSFNSADTNPAVGAMTSSGEEARKILGSHEDDKHRSNVLKEKNAYNFDKIFKSLTEDKLDSDIKVFNNNVGKLEQGTKDKADKAKAIATSRLLQYEDGSTESDIGNLLPNGYVEGQFVNILKKMKTYRDNENKIVDKDVFKKIIDGLTTDNIDIFKKTLIDIHKEKIDAIKNILYPSGGSHNKTDQELFEDLMEVVINASRQTFSGNHNSDGKKASSILKNVYEEWSNLDQDHKNFYGETAHTGFMSLFRKSLNDDIDTYVNPRSYEESLGESKYRVNLDKASYFYVKFASMLPCFPDNDCSHVFSANCVALGGHYIGNNGIIENSATLDPTKGENNIASYVEKCQIVIKDCNFFRNLYMMVYCPEVFRVTGTIDDERRDNLQKANFVLTPDKGSLNVAGEDGVEVLLLNFANQTPKYNINCEYYTLRGGTKDGNGGNNNKKWGVTKKINGGATVSFTDLLAIPLNYNDYVKFFPGKDNLKSLNMPLLRKLTSLPEITVAPSSKVGSATLYFNKLGGGRIKERVVMMTGGSSDCAKDGQPSTWCEDVLFCLLNTNEVDEIQDCLEKARKNTNDFKLFVNHINNVDHKVLKRVVARFQVPTIESNSSVHKGKIDNLLTTGQWIQYLYNQKGNKGELKHDILVKISEFGDKSNTEKEKGQNIYGNFLSVMDKIIRHINSNPEILNPVISRGDVTSWKQSKYGKDIELPVRVDPKARGLTNDHFMTMFRENRRKNEMLHTDPFKINSLVPPQITGSLGEMSGGSRKKGGAVVFKYPSSGEGNTPVIGHEFLNKIFETLKDNLKAHGKKISENDWNRIKRDMSKLKSNEDDLVRLAYKIDDMNKTLYKFPDLKNDTYTESEMDSYVGKYKEKLDDSSNIHNAMEKILHQLVKLETRMSFGH